MQNCNFDKPVRRPAYHREHISGELDLFNVDICNVTQLLPLDAMEDLSIHHLSNENNERTPWKVLTTTDLYKRRMGELMRMDGNK